MLRTFLVALSLAVCFLPRTIAATDPPAGSAQPPEERFFLLYLLEDFYRDTWPDESSVGDTPQIEAFVARHKTLADDLRRHIEKAKLGEDLADLYYSYGKFLDVLMSKSAKVVKDHKEVQRRLFFNKQEELRRDWANKIGGAAIQEIERSRQNARMSSDLFDGITTAAFAFLNFQVAIAGATTEARNSWRDHFNTVKDEYAKTAGQMRKDFIQAIQKDRQEQCGTAAIAAAALAKKLGKKSADLPFDALAPLTGSREEERPRDALRTARLIRLRAEGIRKLPASRETAKAHLQFAQLYLDAAKLVPLFKEYHFVRVNLYRAAGEEANLASAQQLGAADFIKGTPTEAGKTAVIAWEKYHAFQRKDRLDGHTLHQIVLACAYAHQIGKAYIVLRSNCDYWPLDPAFLYDAARLCSIWAESLAGRPAEMMASCEAARIFGLAVDAGFQDLKAAAEIRDLEWLRIRHRKWFECVANGKDPPPLPVVAGADSPILGDAFKVGSIWKGNKKVSVPRTTRFAMVPIKLVVKRRDEKSFTAEIVRGSAKAETISGAIANGKVSWKERGANYEGTLFGNKVTFKDLVLTQE